MDYDFRKLFLFIIIAAAAAGWAIIQGILWLINNISIHVG